MSESIIIALIGAAGTIIAALIGLFAVRLAKASQSSDHHGEDAPTGRRHPFFYMMIFAA